MKCPYQTIITHKPERTRGSGVEFAKDITEFGECAKSECPFYYETIVEWRPKKVKEHCHKVESEVKE